MGKKTLCRRPSKWQIACTVELSAVTMVVSRLSTLSTLRSKTSLLSETWVVAHVGHEASLVEENAVAAVHCTCSQTYFPPTRTWRRHRVLQGPPRGNDGHLSIWPRCIKISVSLPVYSFLSLQVDGKNTRNFVNSTLTTNHGAICSGIWPSVSLHSGA